MDQYYIRVRGYEIGWVYLYKEGSFENERLIHLINELVLGDEDKQAIKAEYKMISKEQYDQIVEATAQDNDVAELLRIALQ
jgi:hypothetical protein